MNYSFTLIRIIALNVIEVWGPVYALYTQQTLEALCW